MPLVSGSASRCLSRAEFGSIFERLATMMSGKVDLFAYENPLSLLLETSLIFVRCQGLICLRTSMPTLSLFAVLGSSLLGFLYIASC